MSKRCYFYVILNGFVREMGMAKLLARLLATEALWVRVQTSLKNTRMGDISKCGTNTL
jgi:hypothetical protein